MAASKNIKKSDSVIAVVALALQRSDGRFLLARRGPGQSGAGEWEFPGGKIEENETQIEALCREIIEELSFQLDPEKLVFVAEHTHPYPNKTIQLFLWTQKIKTLPEIILTEHDQICWCSPEEMETLGISQGDRAFIKLIKTI